MKIRFRLYPLFISALLLLNTIPLLGQQDTTLDATVENTKLQKDTNQLIEGKITITSTRSISEIIKLYNTYTSESPKSKGYRIEIFSESGSGSRKKAGRVKDKFEEEFEDIPAYVKWEYPNFEVRAGDFRTKLEAEKHLIKIKEVFPFAYIKKDQIEPPALPELNPTLEEDD